MVDPDSCMTSSINASSEHMEGFSYQISKGRIRRDTLVFVLSALSTGRSHHVSAQSVKLAQGQNQACGQKWIKSRVLSPV